MHKSRIFTTLLLAVYVSAAYSTAQPAPQGMPTQGQMSQGTGQLGGAPSGPSLITAAQLTPNVYWIRNMGFGAFIVGDKGVIVLYSSSSPASAKQILDLVAKVTPKPVTTVILSNADGGHVDGLNAFPAGIQIIAQKNAKKTMQEELARGASGPEAPKFDAAHLPNHTVASHEDLTISGERFELYHWAPAHSDDDLITYLPKEKIVFFGALLVLDQHGLPLIQQEKRGTSAGWIKSVQEALKLDASLYIAGHGGAIIRDAVQKQLDTAIAERQKIKELYNKGMPLKDIQAAVGDPVPNAGPPRFPPFSAVVYNELKAGTF